MSNTTNPLEEEIEKLYNEWLFIMQLDRSDADYETFKAGYEASKESNTDYNCNICGGTMATIRGRYPNDPDRVVCPTCNTEKLESIESSNWRLTKLTNE